METGSDKLQAASYNTGMCRGLDQKVVLRAGTGCRRRGHRGGAARAFEVWHRVSGRVAACSLWLAAPRVTNDSLKACSDIRPGMTEHRADFGVTMFLCFALRVNYESTGEGASEFV